MKLSTRRKIHKVLDFVKIAVEMDFCYSKNNCEILTERNWFTKDAFKGSKLNELWQKNEPNWSHCKVIIKIARIYSNF